MPRNSSNQSLGDGFERVANPPEGLEKARDSSDSEGDDGGRGGSASFTLEMADQPVDAILAEDVAALNELYHQVVGECREAYDQVKTMLSDRMESERRSVTQSAQSAGSPEARPIEGQLNATATRQLSTMLQVLEDEADPAPYLFLFDRDRRDRNATGAGLKEAAPPANRVHRGQRARVPENPQKDVVLPEK